MVLYCRAALRTGPFPRGLAWFGIVNGALWILASGLTWIGGPMPSDMNSMGDPSKMNPFLLADFILFFFAYVAQPIWALWLGRVLRARSSINTLPDALHEGMKV